MSAQHRGQHQGSTRRVSALKVVAAGCAALGLIATTSCTSTPQAQQVDDPTKLLQNVRVDLSPTAAITSLKGTVIRAGEDGTSSSSDTTYDASKTADDLPVRVALRYTAGDRTGTDLSDLQGYSGPLQIDLTLENLTVRPQELNYDVAGSSRTSTALVGAPFTVAASTTLPGVRPSDVTPASADGSTGTNGVLSTDTSGATQVQWATVLAPPTSGASATLRLQADVKSLDAPSFDISVQPGLSTDLSGESVVADALGGDDSERRLQERTIELVSDVNSVLTRAGATITDVRSGLEASADTLGVQTATQLRDNSKALAGTMRSLKERLGTLQQDLASTTDASSQATVQQLEQTVSAVDSLLGDTSASSAPAPIKGSGCSATVAKPDKSSTVYSSLLTMSSQLDAYATVNAACRDTVASALKVTLGPAKPTAEDCRKQYSMTCSLYGSAAAVTVSLVKLVDRGDELVEQLQPEVVEQAITAHDDADEDLKTASDQVEKLLKEKPGSDEYRAAHVALFGGKDAENNVVPGALKEAKDALHTSVNTTRTALTSAQESAQAHLHAIYSSADTDGSPPLAQAHDIAGTAQSDTASGQETSKGMSRQTDWIAQQVCTMAKTGVFEQAQAAALVKQLNGSSCSDQGDQGDDSQTPPSDSLAGKIKDQEDLLTAQAQAWQKVADLTDPDNGDIAQAIKSVEDELAAGQNDLNDVDTAIDDALDQRGWGKGGSVTEAAHALDDAANGRTADTTKRLKELQGTLKQAQDSSTTLGPKLEALQTQQDDLGTTLKKQLQDISDETMKEVLQATQAQARQVSRIGDEGSDAVVKAFNRSIDGLTSTSHDVVKDAKGTVDSQRADLKKQGDAAAAELDQRTQASLKDISSSTAGATKDVEGARTLLADSLHRVMLDLGDRKVNGSGLLGAMSTNAAKAGTADYQMALASQNAEGYANIRSQDVAALLLRQAQVKASLVAADELPGFQLEVPDGATSQTLYTLHVSGGSGSKSSTGGDGQ